MARSLTTTSKRRAASAASASPAVPAAGAASSGDSARGSWRSLRARSHSALRSNATCSVSASRQRPLPGGVSLHSTQAQSSRTTAGLTLDAVDQDEAAARRLQPHGEQRLVLLGLVPALGRLAGREL